MTTRGRSTGYQPEPLKTSTNTSTVTDNETNLTFSTIPGTYGDWLRHQRESTGLSQEALGSLVGVSGTYVNRIENRRISTPFIPMRLRIHDVLGTSDSDPELLPLLSKCDHLTHCEIDHLQDELTCYRAEHAGEWIKRSSRPDRTGVQGIISDLQAELDRLYTLYNAGQLKRSFAVGNSSIWIWVFEGEFRISDYLAASGIKLQGVTVSRGDTESRGPLPDCTSGYRDFRVFGDRCW